MARLLGLGPIAIGPVVYIGRLQYLVYQYTALIE
jgi:hypothetical protein